MPPIANILPQRLHKAAENKLQAHRGVLPDNYPAILHRHFLQPVLLRDSHPGILPSVKSKEHPKQPQQYLDTHSDKQYSADKGPYMSYCSLHLLFLPFFCSKALFRECCIPFPSKRNTAWVLPDQVHLHAVLLSKPIFPFPVSLPK